LLKPVLPGVEFRLLVPNEAAPLVDLDLLMAAKHWTTRVLDSIRRRQILEPNLSVAEPSESGSNGTGPATGHQNLLDGRASQTTA
jgi:hypothetical protein